jgi:hypothetical protein
MFKFCKICFVLLLTGIGFFTAHINGAELLQWEGDEGKVLFTVKDIVRFDWERQVFELKRERAMDLRAYMDGALDRRYVVRDAVGSVYEGRFVSSLSSMSYSGPVMQLDKAPLFEIRDGYGAPRQEGEDKRFSPRLNEDLQKAGVLKRINTNEVIEPIGYSFGGWARGKGLIGLETFPFRIGEMARIHILFRDIQVEADSIQVDTTLTQGGGFSSTSIQKFNTVIHTKGVQIVRWNPWTTEGVKGKAQPGSVNLKVRVEMRKKTPQGEISVYAVELPEKGAPSLAILPP